VSPLDGITAAFADSEITYSLGAIVQEGVAEFDRDSMTNPRTGEAGALVQMLSADGSVSYEEDRLASALVYFGGDAPIERMTTFVFETDLTPSTTESVRLGFASVGMCRLFVDGELVVEQSTQTEGLDLGAALLAPPTVSVPVALEKGHTLRVRVEVEPNRLEGGLSNAFSITIGFEPDEIDASLLIAEAAAAAAAADIAVVVVGTNARVESEGYDRTDLSLPGAQDDLVRAVIAANPRTVVVVNSGSPVLLPWRDEAAAVLLTYFGGQEYGNAVADILSGALEPGGRLPTTWPATFEDVPVIDVTPVDGVVAYKEGIHIGYRAWLRSDKTPAYPFGYGLGYTEWSISDTVTDGFTGDVAIVTSTVTNTGARSGKHVVQVYAERDGSVVDRPVRWLVGYAVVRAAAGESVDVAIPVSRRSLAYWDREWTYEPGDYVLRVGSSVLDLPDQVTVTL
jgi:beta-glucosidase